MMTMTGHFVLLLQNDLYLRPQSHNCCPFKDSYKMFTIFLLPWLFTVLRRSNQWFYVTIICYKRKATFNHHSLWSSYGDLFVLTLIRWFETFVLHKSGPWREHILVSALSNYKVIRTLLYLNTSLNNRHHSEGESGSDECGWSEGLARRRTAWREGNGRDTRDPNMLTIGMMTSMSFHQHISPSTMYTY